MFQPSCLLQKSLAGTTADPDAFDALKQEKIGMEFWQVALPSPNLFAV
jgi:hypothetical protein